MIYESKSKFEKLLEKPLFYVFAVIAVLVACYQHYQFNKDSYSPSKEQVQKMENVKQEHLSFLKKLEANDCYAVNVVQRFEKDNGVIAQDVINRQPNAHSSLRTISYIFEDGKYYRLSSYTVNNNYVVQFFNKNVEYKCLKGGFSFSTPYYFKSRDFKKMV